MTAISLAPGLTEVTVFGGSNSFYVEGYNIAATTIIIFGELSLCPHRMDDWRGGYLGFHETSLSAGSGIFVSHTSPFCEILRKGLVSIPM